MFEVTYRVAIEYCVLKPKCSLEKKQMHLERRAYLATKPDIGESICVPLIDKNTMTRFVVTKVEHCTHLSPPQPLSYIPEFLGVLTLVIEGYDYDVETGIARAPYELSAEIWERRMFDATGLGWEVRK